MLSWVKIFFCQTREGYELNCEIQAHMILSDHFLNLLKHSYCFKSICRNLRNYLNHLFTVL